MKQPRHNSAKENCYDLQYRASGRQGGSTRGIGYAIVKRFAEEGATVYMAARNAERAQAKIDELAAANLPGTAKFVYNDASKDETYVSAVEQVVANEGCIDVLVNNLARPIPPRISTSSTPTRRSSSTRWISTSSPCPLRRRQR